MAGPNLELFKFGLYLFFPLAVMLHYGDVEFYNRNVLPIRDQFWPKAEDLYRPPRDSEGVKNALEEYKQKRIAKREARLQEEQGSTPTAAATPQPEAKTDSKISDMVREQKSNQRLV